MLFEPAGRVPGVTGFIIPWVSLAAAITRFVMPGGVALARREVAASAWLKCLIPAWLWTMPRGVGYFDPWAPHTGPIASRTRRHMGIFSEIFSWWGGNTWGTRVTIWRQGRHVGTDEMGNHYYVQKRGVGPLGVPRRWVVYQHLAEASQVPPEWHGWLHHTVDTIPTAEDYAPRPWQKPHRMNMTGTSEAYRPAGSILAQAKRPKATGDYKPWRPS